MYEQLIEILAKSRKEGKFVILAGDWNAEVGSPETADGRERPIKVTVGDEVRGLNVGEVIFLDEEGLVVEEPTP